MLFGAPEQLNQIPFTKVESIGNDFVLIERGIVRSEDLPAFTQQVCRRHFSIGSDGLLEIGREDSHLVLRMLNPDGTEDFCGNGLRCAAMYAYKLSWTGREAVIHHLQKVVHTRIQEDGSVRSEFEPADFTPSVVPVLAEGEVFQLPLEVLGQQLLVNSLSTGSTHTIIFGDIPGEEDFVKLSEALENHPMFPERTSVIWTRVDAERDLTIRIWERGAGETRGCGTGSSAAAAAYFRVSGLHGHVNVHNPGGTVRAVMAEWNAPIYTEAKAELLFNGVVTAQVPSPACAR
jgi:diaminopimelate epimerase